MADTVMTYKITVKEIARRYGYHASFMPKPIFGQNGSGMHVHQSLFQGKRNVMFDPGNEFNLSDEGRYYIAGLLRHAPEITAVTNQWVNSYKRLVPGYEAPVYIAWARRNRSSLVRVPMYKPGKEAATRVEYRSPDPAANPYLAFSVMLAAGLAGIANKYDLPSPQEQDIYHMTDEQRRKQESRPFRQPERCHPHHREEHPRPGGFRRARLPGLHLQQEGRVGCLPHERHPVGA